MIEINCTHCQQRLEMDEAFAGGVCRCQYCGAIQTVPSHLKKQTSAAAIAPAAGKVTHPGGGSGTGLDDLAEVVASSGLSRSSLTKNGRQGQRTSAGGAATAATAAPSSRGSSSSSATVDHAAPREQKRSAMVPLFIGVSVLTLVALGVIAFMMLSKGNSGSAVVVPNPNPPVKPGPDDQDEPDTLTIPGPAFADVPLTANSVVYLVDRSHANTEVLDTLKAAVYHSAISLGQGKKFQIIFWSHHEEGIVAYPENGFAPATQAEVDAAGKQFENVIGYGNTELRPTLDRAVASRPDAIVIATTKGPYLEDDTLAAFDEALKGTKIKVHAFSLGETESPVLKQVAEKTGGRYRELSQRQLKKLKYHVPRG